MMILVTIFFSKFPVLLKSVDFVMNHLSLLEFSNRIENETFAFDGCYAQPRFSYENS